jgi:nucleoside-diphosphate-sugar epimerase
MARSKVLLTGSSGSIGSAIAERLVKEYEVIGLDLRPGKFTHFTGDIADTCLVQKLVRQVEGVVHVASLHAPHVATHSRTGFIETNIHGTEVLLSAASRQGVTRFVYTSTTSVYGDAMVPVDRAVWVTEKLAVRPRDIYDETKLAAEALCQEWAAQNQSTCVVLRMSRCFPEPERLMAVYRLYRGVDRRDVAEAHALALRWNQQPFAIFNISSQSPFKEEDAKQLHTDAASVIGLRCPRFADEFGRRGWTLPHQIDRVYVIDHARDRLGYRPRYGFAELLAGT